MATARVEIDQELISKAQDYQQVTVDPKWKRLLDNLAKVNDNILTQIRLTPPWEEAKIKALMLQWRHFENYLQLIQNEVLGTIEDRNNYVRTVLKGEYGLPEDRIENLIRSING